MVTFHVHLFTAVPLLLATTLFATERETRVPRPAADWETITWAYEIIKSEVEWMSE